MSATFAELESQLEKASADADQRFRDLGVRCVEGEIIDVDAESIVRTFAASGRGMPELKRLRKRLQHRKSLAENREQAIQLLDKRKANEQRLAELRKAVNKMVADHEAALKLKLIELSELGSEISQAAHRAASLERDAIVSLQGSAADGLDWSDWRNASLEFSAPAPGLEGLPML